MLIHCALNKMWRIGAGILYSAKQDCMITYEDYLGIVGCLVWAAISQRLIKNSNEVFS